MAEAAQSRIVECPSCGAKNRVSQTAAAGREPVCGRCHELLPNEAAKPVVVTDANFSSTVESSKLPVLLDLWAAWCGPCRMVAPIIEQLASELSGRVLVGKMDVDANPRTSARFGVQSIPTLLVLKDGREVDRIVGAAPKSSIMQRLERHI
jgi:thioredoxin 2